MPDYPAWKYFKAVPNTDSFSAEYNPNKHVPFISNEADAVANIQLFRGLVGLIQAIQKGLTPEQINHIQTVIFRNRLSPDRSALVQDHINKITESYKTNDLALIQSCMLSAKNEFKRDTLEFSYLRAGLSRLKGVDLPDDILPSLTNKKDLNIDDFTTRFREAVQMAIEKHPQYKDNLNRLSKQVLAKTAARDKESFKGQKILEELLHTDLSSAQQKDLLSIFEVQDGASNALLNDVLNAHPIAAKLLGDRLDMFFRDFISYTQNYKEGAETLFPDVSTDPAFEKGWKKDPHFQSPTPNHLPFGSPLEEVYQWKLERLAQLFNLDLSTTLGLSQFDILSHSYDLSPGELTLERTHTYPAFYHTYEELPIIKYDGYDPFEDPHSKTELTITNQEVDDLVLLIPK
jgi:hypothetical protein